MKIEPTEGEEANPPPTRRETARKEPRDHAAPAGDKVQQQAQQQENEQQQERPQLGRTLRGTKSWPLINSKMKNER